MIIDLSENRNYIDGNLGESPFSRYIFPSDSLKTSAGLDVCFLTDSPCVDIFFTVPRLIEVSPFIGRLLTNGVNYVVYDQDHNVVRLEGTPPPGPFDVGKGFVHIYDNPARKPLEYHFRLPHFNTVLSFLVRINDGCTISPLPQRKSILFFGGSTLMGRGATFATATYSTMLTNKLRAIEYNLGVNGPFYQKGLVKNTRKKCDPLCIVAELFDTFTTVATVERDLKEYLTSIAHFGLPTVFIEPTFCNTSGALTPVKNNAEQVFSNVYKSFSAPVFLIKAEEILKGFSAEQASLSQYYINDLGHYNIAERLCELIRYF